MTTAYLADRNWATDRWADRAKMARWNNTVAEHMTELHVTADDPLGFNAQWRQLCLGPIDLNVIHTTPQVVRRTPEMTRNSAADTFEIVFMKRGSMIVRERGEELLIRQGDFGILRNIAPYEFECPSENVALSTHVSREWMDRWVRDPERLRSLPWQARSQWGKPLAALLRLIADQGLQDSTIPREAIADQIGSLLSLVARNTPSSQMLRRTTFERVEALLDELYREPDLSPQRLAHESGISKRHLHGLFAGAGTTFGAELVNRRLQYAADRLATSSEDACTVSEVAFEAGFSDPSHFARRFRQRFGCNPSAWRTARKRN